MKTRAIFPCAVALLAAMVSGCETLPTNEVQIRMISTPPGALVYSRSGKAIGMTPMERVLPAALSREDRLEDEAIVVWPSGATVRQRLVIRPMQHRIWTANFSRPANAPGLDVDLAHAARLQQRQQAQAVADVTGLLSAFSESYVARRWQIPQAGFTPPSAIRCTSRRVGWSVVTDCSDRGY